MHVNLFDRPRLVVDLLCLEPEQEESRRGFDRSDSLLMLIEGEARLRAGPQIESLQEMDAVLVPPGQEYVLANTGAGQMVAVVILTPKPLRADDVRVQGDSRPFRTVRDDEAGNGAAPRSSFREDDRQQPARSFTGRDDRPQRDRPFQRRDEGGQRAPYPRRDEGGERGGYPRRDNNGERGAYPRRDDGGQRGPYPRRDDAGPRGAYPRRDDGGERGGYPRRDNNGERSAYPRRDEGGQRSPYPRRDGAPARPPYPRRDGAPNRASRQSSQLRPPAALPSRCRRRRGAAHWAAPRQHRRPASAPKRG